MLTIRSLYRFYLAKKLIEKTKAKQITEIGFADGELLRSVKAEKKIGIDLNEEACRKAPFETHNISEHKYFPDQKTDLLVALEVLEHIKQDQQALQRWNHWIKTKGYLLISVPAKMRHWDNSDVYAGHVRRYERKELVIKLRLAGFEPKLFWCYGFPIYNLIKLVGNILIKKKINKKESREQRTVMSGVRNIEFPYAKLVSNPLTYLFSNLFINTDLGIGYIVLAKKI